MSACCGPEPQKLCDLQVPLFGIWNNNLFPTVFMRIKLEEESEASYPVSRVSFQVSCVFEAVKMLS